MEEYAAEFQSLQFQVSMYNAGYDDVFFVSQFIKGLKDELQGPILMQFPDQVPKAIVLAKIQQRMLDRTKYKHAKTVLQPNKGVIRVNLTPNPVVLIGVKGRNEITGRLMVYAIVVQRSLSLGMLKSVPNVLNNN